VRGPHVGDETRRRVTDTCDKRPLRRVEAVEWAKWGSSASQEWETCIRFSGLGDGGECGGVVGVDGWRRSVLVWFRRGRRAEEVRKAVGSWVDG